MNVRALLRRFWPQKVRTRLTLLYAALFFAAGSALLGLTYGLVASSLPSQPPPAVATVSSRELASLLHECKPGPGGVPNFDACRQADAYMAGSAAGLRAQREHALRELLVFSLVGLAVITVASGGLGWFMAGRVLRPVRVITETARRASEQHLGERPVGRHRAPRDRDRPQPAGRRPRHLNRDPAPPRCGPGQGLSRSPSNATVTMMSASSAGLPPPRGRYHSDTELIIP